MALSLHRFHGGIHPPTHKAESRGQSIVRIAAPPRLILPLAQHIGHAAEPVVEVGAQVLKGQLLAKPSGYVSAAIHAPSSGRVVAIEAMPTPHPSGLPQMSVVIETDGAERWIELQPLIRADTLEPAALRTLIRNQGIVGLGGAMFPTAVKLNVEQRNPLLLINGAECEPYITCDDALMCERSAELLEGILVLLHALSSSQCVIGIEDNKPAAIAAMRQAAQTDARISVVAVPTRYPAGGAKQLIEVITGEQVPMDGHAADIGVICINIGTVYAVKRAVIDGEALISRVVTVTGNVRQPQNFEVPFGTPMQYLIEQAGGAPLPIERVLMGGPLMGVAVHRLEVPVTKASNCVLVMAAEQSQPLGEVMPCIRCAECVHACPASLMPHELYNFARSNNTDKLQEYDLFACIECGACAYVCPSKIPLVHYYRYAKQEIAVRERERERADLARRRNEARLARVAREKAEAEAKRAEKLAAMRKPDPTSE